MPESTHTRAASERLEPLLVGYDDLTKLLGVSRRGLQRMVHQGQLPSPRKLGRRTVFVLTEVRQAIAQLPSKAVSS